MGSILKISLMVVKQLLLSFNRYYPQSSSFRLLLLAVTQSLWLPFNLLPICPLQRCCPNSLRPKGSGAMRPEALSSLLLLLFLVATGDADMKGHFDPGEETGSWVPEGWGLGDRESGALTVCVPVIT